MDLSIIIVNWNTRDLLAQCLLSIQNNVLTFERSNVETFVVDNASTDASAAMVRKRFPHVRLIENAENVGFARANNQAIRQAKGRYVLLLNSDTIVKPGALSAMLTFADQHDAIGVLGPALFDAQGRVQPSWAKFPTIWSELGGVHHRNRKPFGQSAKSVQKIKAYEVDWMAGACLLVRKKAIDQIGLLDERFFLYSEETDWCKRIKEAGWHIVYYPCAHVTHLEGRSSSLDRPRTHFLLYHSKLLYAQKHFGPFSASFLKGGFIILALGKALMRTILGQMATAQSQLKLAQQLWNYKF